MRKDLLALGLLLLVAGCPKQDAGDTTVVTTDTPGADATATDVPAIDTTADATADAAPADAPAAGATGAALVGQPAPDFTLTDYDGQSHTLSAYQGKTVVLEWFDYDCGAVKSYYDKPEIVEKINAGLTRDDVVWLSINSAGEGKGGFGAEPNKAYMAKVGKKNPVLEDASGQVGHSYGAISTPTLVVIAPDGKVVYFGKFDEAAGPQESGKGTNYAIAAVEAVAAGQPVAVPSTQPFG